MNYSGGKWSRLEPPKEQEEQKKAEKFVEIESNRPNANYMSVIYNATLLGAQRRQDINSFYYNSVFYDAAKYS